MNCIRTGWGYILALLLILSGCSHSSLVQPGVTPPQPSAARAPLRVIIHFKQPVTDRQALSAVLAEACHCQPVFFRPYLSDALIYEIALPDGQSFSAFADELMRNAALGIKSVEQDSIMQQQ